MNLYFVKRTDNADYDEYDSFVCAAFDEEAARLTYPYESGGIFWDVDNQCWNCLEYRWAIGGWPVKPVDLSVTFLGVATHGLTAGVICASFNAG